MKGKVTLGNKKSEILKTAPSVESGGEGKSRRDDGDELCRWSADMSKLLSAFSVALSFVGSCSIPLSVTIRRHETWALISFLSLAPLPCACREGREVVLSDLLAPADGAEDSASTQGEESLPANFVPSDSEVRLAVDAARILL